MALVVLRPTPASAAGICSTEGSGAGTCLQNRYCQSTGNANNTNTLSCVSGDVKVAKAINVRDLMGNKVSTCTPGPFPIIVDFLVQTTSNANRSNIGLYFQDDPTATNALNGNCEDGISAPQHTCGPPVTVNGTTITPTATCGSNHYEEFDDPNTSVSSPCTSSTCSPDNCGDTSSTDPSVCLDASNNVVPCTSPHTQTFTSTQIITFELPNFQCPNAANGTQVQLPNCTSWQVPGSSILCTSSAPNWSYPLNGPGGTPTAIPGSSPKCNCGTIPLGITVQTPGVTVHKDCTISNNNPAQNNQETCTFGTSNVEGGDVLYTVTLTNQSNFGNSIVDQVCDDQYGTISDDSQIATKCAAGAQCVRQCTGVNTPYTGCTGSGTGSNLPAGTTCFLDGTPTCSTPITVDGSPVSCTFTATQSESSDIKDIVNVSGHGSSTGTFLGTTSNQVEVISGEAPSSATISKTWVANVGACATVRYSVDVSNGGSFDENLQLTSLADDKAGTLTQCAGTSNGCDNSSPKVLGTTCGVAVNSAGLGTLSGFTVVGPSGTVDATHAPGGVIPTDSTVLQISGTGAKDYKCWFEAQFCSSLPTGTSCFSQTDQITAGFKDDEGNTLTNGTGFTVSGGSLTVNECLSLQ